MNLLAKIKNRLYREFNTDWKVVAMDLNRALIDLQEKYQQANQHIADLEKIVAIYKEKENSK
ncbi:MAG: hypothetical protein E7E08_01955 [Streptococcus mitis]|jgi:hypothetical protein|nr:hypothetical protein [Streptococcus mitis]